MELTLEKIKKMDYSKFVGLIRERNRPSGGIQTIQEVSINARINSEKTMLEIGSNPGFTCVNMSLLTGCKSVGIDFNPESVKEAIRYAKKQEVHNVSFKVATAEKLPFKDESFDIVWCSNVTSFISNKSHAIKEYLRVLKKGGTLVVIPIYYIKAPPSKIIEKISKAIGCKIEVWDKLFWEKLFVDISKTGKYNIEQYYYNDFEYLNQNEFIEEYIKEILNKNFIIKEEENIRQALKEKASYFLRLFNENLIYAGYSILLYQRRCVLDEIELFKTRSIK